MALKLRLTLLARRLLARLAYPPCSPTSCCRPLTQHSTHHIRTVCALCGRTFPWEQVLFDLPTHSPSDTTPTSQPPLPL